MVVKRYEDIGEKFFAELIVSSITSLEAKGV